MAVLPPSTSTMKASVPEANFLSRPPRVGPFKIVVLGEARVGKTSLLRRFVKRSFDEGEAPTNPSSVYVEKCLSIRGGQVQLSLWDTAGQERFHSLAPIYFRDADGALLVYDLHNVDSFRRVANWVAEVRAVGADCALAICGNKADLKLPQARVPLAEAEAYAQSIQARHSVTSAKLGSGVEETFAQLAEDVLDLRIGAAGTGAAISVRRPPRGTVLVEDEQAQRYGIGGNSGSRPGRDGGHGCCVGGRKRARRSTAGENANTRVNLTPG